MNESIFKLYNSFKDEGIDIYENGKVEQTETYAELKYNIVINRIPQYKIEVWNAAIEKVISLTDEDWFCQLPQKEINEIRKLKINE